MQRPKFSKYRYFFRRPITQSNLTYLVMNFMQAFSSVDGSGNNLLVGGVASASNIFNNTYPASAAFDNTTSYWSSLQRGAGLEDWVRYDLPAPVAVGSFNLKIENSAYVYSGFELQGSNNGTDWVTLAKVINPSSAAMATGLVIPTYGKGLEGVALIDTGAAANLVVIMDWTTREVIYQAVPDQNGKWGCPLAIDQALVVTIGPSGVKPEADGPVVPESYTV